MRRELNEEGLKRLEEAREAACGGLPALAAPTCRHDFAQREGRYATNVPVTATPVRGASSSGDDPGDPDERGEEESREDRVAELVLLYVEELALDGGAVARQATRPAVCGGGRW